MPAEQILTKSARSTNEGKGIQRRTFVGGALAALFSPSVRLMADDEHSPNDPFVVLLRGIYQPVPIGQGPAGNLGLNTVDLSSGSFSKTHIYPVFGTDGAKDEKKAIGTFYPQVTFANGKIIFNGFNCVYDLPGGAILMQFLPPPPGAPAGFNGFVPFADGAGGYYLEGTFELTIQESTGIYRDFQGGHNHMVDKLHQQADGSFNEFCFCNVSTYPFP